MKYHHTEKENYPFLNYMNWNPSYPYFSILKGGMSKIKFKEKDEYYYDQYLATLKSMYHYYFNNGSVIQYSIKKEIVS